MKYLTLLLALCALPAMADFDYFEVAYLHDSTGGRSVINSGVDRGCLGARMPLLPEKTARVVSAKLQACAGFERAEGVYSTAASLCYGALCGRVERYGGDSDPTTGIALDWEYTPGKKLFGLQPVVIVGLSYHDQPVTSDSARCLPVDPTALPVKTIGPDPIDCERGLISDRLAFQIGGGFRL